LVWTDAALYRIDYVGEFDQIYDEELLGAKCGLLSPNAVVQTGQGDTYWLSSSYQFFVYAGGEPQEVTCPLRRWFENRVDKDQRLKVVASHDARYPAVVWDYQSTSSEADVDAYVRLDIAEQKADPNAGWSHGSRARSAWASGVVFKARAPLALSPSGVLYQHDLVYGDDGAEIARHIRWAPAQIEDGDKLTVLTRVVVDGVYSDPFTVTYYGRLYPMQAEFSRGPHEINSKGYVDRKMKARQIGMRIDSSSAAFWRLGVLRGDVSSSSAR
jgi:hypothetical protein